MKEKLHKLHGFFIVVANELPISFVQELTRVLEAGDFKVRAQNKGVLAGRGQIITIPLPLVGSVVIKQYSRGGILKAILGRTYLKSRKVRAAREFELLMRAAAVGVNVPDPVAYAWKGRIFYRNWLVTKEIEGAYSLADMSSNNEEEARKVVVEVARQIRLLIDNYICHVDLHPGNVVLGSDGKSYLLDFDKASRYRGRRSKLRDYYLNRWRRAVLKHDLPEFLNELMSLELKVPFHD